MRQLDSELRFRVNVPVRFRDIDIGGHAHHSLALMYFEEARAEYWRAVAGRPGLDDIDYILAQASVRYRERILYPDLLEVRTGVLRLGKKHFRMGYEIRSASGALAVTGETVQIMYDYAAGASKPIPDDVRERIVTHDGPFHRSDRQRSAGTGGG